MEKVSIILALINLVVAAGPLLGIVMIHARNPIEVIVPSEVQELGEAFESFEETLKTIKHVNATYDPEHRTLTLLFSVESSLNVDLRINSIKADVVCVAHGYTLGYAYLTVPVTLAPHRKAHLIVQSQWVSEAEQHIKNQHGGEDSLEIHLVNFVVEINGVVIQIGQPVMLTRIPVKSWKG